MLYASYFDASGEPHVHPCVTIAGAGSTDEKWKVFEREWLKVLQREKVSEFHATDFAASQGEYRQWKGDKGRRSRFLRDLISVAHRHANKLFAATVEIPAWRAVNRDYELEETFFSPYAMAGMAVASQAIKWAKKRAPAGGKVALAFEDGDKGWEGLTILCKKYLRVIPIRLPKSEACPFQIGDMLAWKTRITATNLIPVADRGSASYDEALSDLRQILKELANLNRLMVAPGSPGILSRRSLLENCRKFRVPRRTGSPPSFVLS